MGETKKNSKATSILKNNPLTSIVKGNIGIIVVLIIMCVAVTLATDKFLTTNNIISVLRQISINTYIALGMTLIIIIQTKVQNGIHHTGHGCSRAGTNGY